MEYVRDHGESPPRIPRPNRLLESIEEERRYLRESKEPPLFYRLNALLLRLFNGRNDRDAFHWFGHPVGSNAASLPPDYVARLEEVSPGDAGPMAIRLGAVLSGGLAIYLTWSLALVLFGDRDVALAAAGFMAFLPEFGFLSSSINNDTLCVLFSALALLGMAGWLRSEHAFPWRPISVAVLGTLLALASKLTAVVLAPILL